MRARLSSFNPRSANDGDDQFWVRRGSAPQPLACTLLAAGMAVWPGQAVAGPGIVLASDLETADEVAEVSEDELVEPIQLPELSTETTSTFRMPNGSYRLEAAPEPVNYRDDAGDWHAIDNTLVDAPGATYAVANAANEYTASIPADASAAPIRFEADGAWVTMKMDGADAAPAVEGSSATFEDVEGAESVTYEAVGSGLKESITLQEPPSAQTGRMEYTYILDTSAGLTPTLTSAGAIEFRTAGGAVPVSIPVGNMGDSAMPEPAYSNRVAYDLVGMSGAWRLTVTPDQAWLADPSRVYPVVIDPTLATGAATDCWVQEESPTASRCGNTDFIRVGKAGPSRRRRGLLDFNISSIPNEATVNTATLDLYLDSFQTTGTGAATDYGVYNASKKFDSSATWNSSGANGSWTGGCTCSAIGSNNFNLGGGSNDWKTFGVKTLIENWLDGTWDHNGMVLKQVDDDSTKVLAFRSSTGPSSLPKLTVEYTPPTEPNHTDDAGDRSFWTYETRQLTDKITAKVNVGNGNLLVQADDANIAGVAGWDLALTRYYNSDNATVGGANMGMGWSTSLAESVRLERADSSNRNRMFFFGPSAYRAVFDKTEGGAYQRQGAGITADLDFDANGTGTADDRFTLTWFDESTYAFDGDGRLLETRDKNDNDIDFVWDDTNNRLQTVFDTRGTQARLLYRTDGLLGTVTVENSNNQMMMEWTYATTTPRRRCWRASGWRASARGRSEGPRWPTAPIRTRRSSPLSRTTPTTG